jgi:hypothetical protein
MRRALLILAVGLLIAALTLAVSRQFGVTFLLLPLLFFWRGGGRRDRD